MRKLLLLFILLFLAILIFTSYKLSLKTKNQPQPQVGCTLEAKICSDGTSVGRHGPNCEFYPCPGEKEGILISSPKAGEKISNPAIITGQAKGQWFFEAQFSADLIDDKGSKIGNAILAAKGNWMTEDFVQFEGTLEFEKPLSTSGMLKFLSSNPSGLEENQKTYEMKVKF